MDEKDCLKNNNINITKGRLAILRAMDKNPTAVSAELLLNECEDMGIKIDLSTIYRNLELLEEKGIIEKFDLGYGKYNFILRKDDHRHKHILKCEMCKKLVEIDCPMLQIEEIIKDKTGFTLVNHELKINGICKECRKAIGLKKLQILYDTNGKNKK